MHYFKFDNLLCTLGLLRTTPATIHNNHKKCSLLKSSLGPFGGLVFNFILRINIFFVTEIVNMRILSLMILLVIQSSCSWKKDKDNASALLESKNVLNIERPNDLDGDLLDDDEESKLGTNPLDANIPELRVFHAPLVTFSIRLEKDGLIKTVKIDSGASERDVRVNKLLNAKNDRVINRIAKLHLRELQDEVLSTSDLFETFEDNISVLPIKDKAMFEYLDYKNQGFKVKDGYVYLSFQLEGSGLSAVTKLDKITFSVGTISDESKFSELFYFPELYNPNGTPAILENFGDLDTFKDGRIFKTALNAISGSKMEEILSRRQSLAIMFNDFTITRHNKTYSYKNLKDTISASNAYVLLKTGSSYRRIITPYKRSLENILGDYHKDIRYDSSLNITSIDNYGSTMVFPINIDILSAQNLDNGNWRIIAPERTIKTIPLTKTVTIVSYSSVGEFLDNLKKNNSDKPIEFLNRETINIDNVNNNDEVMFEFFETSIHDDNSSTHQGNKSYKTYVCTILPSIEDSSNIRIPGGESRPEPCREKNFTCFYNYSVLTRVNSVTGTKLNLRDIKIKSQEEFYPIQTFMDDPEDFYYDHKGKLQLILKLEPKIINEGILTIYKEKIIERFNLSVGWKDGCDTAIQDVHRTKSITGEKEYLVSGVLKRIKTNYKEM